MTRDVSRETTARLSAYSDLLRRWNPRINLVSPATLAEMDERHIADSAQLADLISPQGRWVDLGSGGGLPGLVVSILWQHIDVNITLVESDRRKAAFLREMVRQLSLQRVRVLAERIESVDPLVADNVSVRALASLPKLMPYLSRHLAPTGRAWLMKGRSWREELAAAQSDWTFSHQIHPSRTAPDAAILEVSRPTHV